MLNNSTKTLFLMTLLLGMFITISSNSWLSAWMGLEINLLSFIPIMSNNKNIFTMEASLKYFLIQALASSTLLFIIISKSILENLFTFGISPMNFMVTIPLLMKTGAAPLHWWFPSVMEGLNWSNCFILMTVQKIAPLILISYLIDFNVFFMFIIMSSVLVGTVGGYNQISIRKILTYSSINHLGWMLTAMTISENLWALYFLIYSSLTLAIIYIIKPLQISFINQTFLLNNNNKIMKFLLFSSLLSLGGLPPFLGFLPKWMVIQSMINNSSILIMSVMVILSLITLYYYLRISYSAFIILSYENSWNMIPDNSGVFSLSMTVMLSMFSVLGMILCSILINFVN
uniref:NADH-ubiquinone oxidoreductase chain 2 n=1 Tax=Panchlora nivea TaxID=36955 RepID=A0A143GV20_9NEOP|nr:NADH dehydrogenase subunit 2 [Panchlora nivea]AMW91053.1 NADH dehydrogenase subunit 2 [Panchlora nivea]